jgi:hypothetical protein
MWKWIFGKKKKPEQETDRCLQYWKKNAEEDYLMTHISVLKYISKLESKIENLCA